MAKKTKWRCMVCAYVYDPAVGDPDSGVKPGTPFSALPDDWGCPLCGVGKDKTALIDCVKKEFAEDLFRNISRFLPVEKLDTVVINHSEPDHAGALVDLLKRNPRVTVFLSRSAKSFVDHLVTAEYSLRIVKENEEVPLGGKTPP